jgi:hypothetical protein
MHKSIAQQKRYRHICHTDEKINFIYFFVVANVNLLAIP